MCPKIVHHAGYTLFIQDAYYPSVHLSVQDVPVNNKSSPTMFIYTYAIISVVIPYMYKFLRDVNFAVFVGNLSPTNLNP